MVLTRQRCLIHAGREAAARCGRCGRFFCRECVTEHGGAMTCAACLREIGAASRRGALQTRRWRRPAAAFGRTLAVGIGVLTACVFFHLVGRVLLASPDDFHVGTLWEAVGGSGGD